MSSIIYLISLPRSGSTIIQRIIASSSQVKYVPETWFFISMYQFLENLDGYSEYGYDAAKVALNYHVSSNKKSEYFDATRNMYRRLYGDENKEWIIEKTPRNILVMDSLYESLREDDRIIILHRNNRDILSSYLRYFDRFPFVKFYKFLREIDDLSSRLNQFENEHLDDNRILSLNYDMLIKDSNTVLKKLSDFLCLGDLSLSLDKAPTDIKGFGDDRAKLSRSIEYLNKRDLPFWISYFKWIYMFTPFGLLSVMVYALNINVFIRRILGRPFVH